MMTIRINQNFKTRFRHWKSLIERNSAEIQNQFVLPAHPPVIIAMAYYCLRRWLHLQAATAKLQLKCAHLNGKQLNPHSPWKYLHNLGIISYPLDPTTQSPPLENRYFYQSPSFIIRLMNDSRIPAFNNKLGIYQKPRIPPFFHPSPHTRASHVSAFRCVVIVRSRGPIIRLSCLDCRASIILAILHSRTYSGKHSLFDVKHLVRPWRHSPVIDGPARSPS